MEDEIKAKIQELEKEISSWKGVIKEAEYKIQWAENSIDLALDEINELYNKLADFK